MLLSFGSSTYPIIGSPDIAIGPMHPPPWIARAVISSAHLSASPADYAERAVIREGDDLDGRIVYQGWVTQAEPTDQTCTLTMEMAPNLRETSIEGWAWGPGLKDTEAFWTTSRLAGFPRERLNVRGFNPPEEPLLVVMPVDGLTVDEDITVLGVTFTSRSPENEWQRVKPDEQLHRRFFDAPAWARIELRGRALLDVEVEGRALIEGAVLAVRVAAGYSYSADPQGKLRAFNRLASHEWVRVRPAIGIRGRVTPRRWIRSVRTGRATMAVNPASLVDRLPPGSGPIGSIKLREALSAFARSIAESRPIRASVAISDGLEFYGAGADPKPEFTDAEVAAMVKAAADTLDTSDRRRRALVRDYVAQLATPRTMDRVIHRMTEDGVPRRPDEVKVLRRLRRHRAAYAHGGVWEEPDSEDIEVGRAVLGRLLLYALRKDQE